MRNIPKEGEFYRHFKGNIYQIQAVAQHSETGEKMVVYQAMYPPFGVWVRPLQMFMEKTDRQKYPQASQEYRFQKVVYQDGKAYLVQEIPDENRRGNLQENEKNFSVEKNVNREMRNLPCGDFKISDEELRKIFLNRQVQRKLEGKMSEEEIATRGVSILLDAENYKERREIFLSLRNYLKEKDLNNISVAFDITLNDGSLEDKYLSVLHCFETFEKYEGSHLRL